MEPGKNNPSHQVSARHTEDGDRFNRTLFDALDALETAKLPYALIGGVAASGLGRPRSTHDIDIFVRPEDAEAAIDALAKNHFLTEKTDYNWLFKGWKEDILVDIIFKSSGDMYFDDEMHKRARAINFHDRQVKVVAPEDFIIIKSAVHNEIGPHHWHDALAVLSHAHLDWEYLLKRARRAPRRVLALLIYGQSNDILVPNRIIQTLFKSIFEDDQAHAQNAVGSFQQSTSPLGGFSLHRRVENDVYVVGRIKDALAQDSRTGDQNIKIVAEQNHILVRGECASEEQKLAIIEVIKTIVPACEVDNQITVPVLPGPEGAEAVV
ncbi:MAG: nucleotidyltransferase [Oligoflexia bacterium]|nr:nucleotidyltransferase [Oligoflexia bacterium]